MFRHVVLLTFDDAASSEQLQAAYDAIATMPNLVPTIRGYKIGLDAGMADTNADLAIVADFDDQAGYEVYRDHPEHQRIIRENILPILALRTVVQHPW